MIDLADFQRRFYHDGPDIPETPELQTAEREYRKAFLAAAREAANWHEPDEAALKKAWNARRQARRRAEENVDGAFVMYRPGHSYESSAWARAGWICGRPNNAPPAVGGGTRANFHADALETQS